MSGLSLSTHCLVRTSAVRNVHGNTHTRDRAADMVGSSLRLAAGGEWIRTSGSAMRSLIANSAALVEAA